MARPRSSHEQIFVVSPSDVLRWRIAGALAPEEYAVRHAKEACDLARQRRQRPFFLCFIDVRGPGVGAGAELRECFRARPAERYVLVLDPWQAACGSVVPEGMEIFGFLREPFSSDEVLAWSRRASDEDRLLHGDRSLEDLLYSRFRSFLQDLGPHAMTSLYDLVLEQVERPLITAVLEVTRGNQTRAARILGIHRNTLRAKIRSLGIGPS